VARTEQPTHHRHAHLAGAHERHRAHPGSLTVWQPGSIETWELAAREAIRDTLAHYTWSGDAGRADELALAFCEDGVLEVRGQPPVEGRPAIAAFIGGVAAGPADPPPVPATRRIVRHNLTNIRFTELAPTIARVESYFTVLTEVGLDHYGRYRDTFVPVDDRWLIRHRFVATDWRSPDSTMAREP
jgi:hypothetical protein